MSRRFQKRPLKGRSKSQASQQGKSNLPKNAAPVRVKITHIGGRGDGVGTAEYSYQYQTKTHQVFVPDTLPGEEVIAQPTHINGQGIQGVLTELITSAPERKSPDCGASPRCGGCQFQHMSFEAYQKWKDSQIHHIFEKFNIEPHHWRAPFTASPQMRRRARVAFRRRKDDVIIGFRERSTHHIIFPEDCHILAPSLYETIIQLRDDILQCLHNGLFGEIDITLCDNGCDVSVHYDTSWPEEVMRDLTIKAASSSIIRLTMIEKGTDPYLLFTSQTPAIRWTLPKGASKNAITLHPAPASFLQADRQAEQVMAHDIYDALSSCEMILDLFSGSGTLSAPLLFRDPAPRKISAYDSGKDAIACYEALAHQAGKSMQLDTNVRNLFHAPLTAKELEAYDGVILDPPRAGASAQMPTIANSRIGHVIMVSCNPHSFAKDAALLLEGGYQCQWARHIDQFLLTSHSEVIAYFTKQVDES